MSAFKLHGMEGVRASLKRLPAELMKSAEKQVLRDGAKPVLSAAKGRVAVADGLLKKSLGVTVKKRRAGVMTSRIGPRSGFKGKSLGMKLSKKGKTKGTVTERFANPVNYAHLVEYGTSHSAAKPFIRPAIEASKGEVVDAMAQGLEKHLTKVCAKLASGKKVFR